jgi:hypothetical protein
MGNRVERIQTNVSDSQMAQAISEGWNELFHSYPNQQQVSLIMAQNALETGQDRKGMWNYNVGNIKAHPKHPESGATDYFYLHAPEQTAPGKWEKFTMPFRAYPTLQAGVLDYLRLLSTSGNYKQAWQHILEPDPVAFSKALKKGGYYTANEESYTRLISNLYGKYMHGPQNSSSSDMTAILNNYLQQIAASEKRNKKLYKNYLPTNHVVIQIKSDNYINAVEFSRILCAALDEELLSRSFTHTDGNQVEVECAIPGPEYECFETVKQLTNSIADAFKLATIKLGGLKVKTECIMNKKSSYQQISLASANNQYRKFLLKFI